jgi:hypothetical protein
MKKIIFSLILLLFSLSSISQTKLISPVVRNSPSDSSYGTHYDSLGYGGYVVFSNITTRNAFPSAQRKIGMIASVDTSLYQLQGGINNSNWARVSFSSVTAITQGYGIRVDSLDRVYTVRVDSTIVGSKTYIDAKDALKLNITDTIGNGDLFIRNLTTQENKRFNVKGGRLDTLYASTSGGGRVVSNGGTIAAEWGAGGGANFDFHGFAGYNLNRAASYTTRSFTDKNYVDSSLTLKTTVTSFGKNATRDSTILLLSNGTRFAAKDSIGSVGAFVPLSGTIDAAPLTGRIRTTNDYGIWKQWGANDSYANKILTTGVIDGFNNVPSNGAAPADYMSAVHVGDVKKVAGEEVAYSRLKSTATDFDGTDTTAMIYTEAKARGGITSKVIVNAGQGLEGAADYTASYSANSFVQKGYVDAQVATKLNSLITANRQTANYTLVLTDANKLVEANVGSANTLTVPLNSSVAFTIGTKIDVAQYGAGQTTITAAGGVTIRSFGGALKIAGQYGAATLVKIGTDEWYCFGNLSN